MKGPFWICLNFFSSVFFLFRLCWWHFVSIRIVNCSTHLPLSFTIRVHPIQCRSSENHRWVIEWRIRWRYILSKCMRQVWKQWNWLSNLLVISFYSYSFAVPFFCLYVVGFFSLALCGDINHCLMSNWIRTHAHTTHPSRSSSTSSRAKSGFHRKPNKSAQHSENVTISNYPEAGAGITLQRLATTIAARGNRIATNGFGRRACRST